MTRRKNPQSTSKNRKSARPGSPNRSASNTVSRGEGGQGGSKRKGSVGSEPAVRQSDASPTQSDTPTPQKRKPGRPATQAKLEPEGPDTDCPYGDPNHEPKGPPYTPADFLAVLREFSQGEPLRRVCRRPGYPSFQRVYQRAKEDEEFGRRLACATLEFEDALFDEILDIADDSSEDYKVVMTKSGPREVFDAQHVQRSKLRVETREKWLATRNNRKFGEKLAVDATHTFVRKVFRKGGSDGN